MPINERVLTNAEFSFCRWCREPIFRLKITMPDGTVNNGTWHSRPKVEASIDDADVTAVRAAKICMSQVNRQAHSRSRTSWLHQPMSDEAVVTWKKKRVEVAVTELDNILGRYPNG